MNLSIWHGILQAVASFAVVAGVYLLAGLAYALVIGGTCTLLVSIAAEASRPRVERKPPHVETGQ